MARGYQGHLFEWTRKPPAGLHHFERGYHMAVVLHLQVLEQHGA